MKLTCQILVAVQLIAGFLWMLRGDFRGAPVREPYGFSGAVGTVILTILFALMFFKAGAFSLLIP